LSSIKKLAGQTVIYGGTSIIGRLLNYLLVPIHTYVFPNPNDYGVVGEMYAWVGLLIVLLTYGMETAFFRFNAQAPDDEKNKIYGTSLISLLVTSVLFIVGMLVFRQNVADTMNYSSHPEYISWFVLVIAFDAISTLPFARLRAQNRPRKFAFVKLSNIFINIVLTLFFLIICPWMLNHNILPDVINAIYSKDIGIGYIFIANLAASGITLLLLFSEIRIPRLSFDWKIWKQMFYYAFPLLIFGLAGIVNETMDRLFLKALSPADIAQGQVGIYSACYKISIMMTIFIQAFKYAAEPFFFAKSKDSDARHTYSKVMTYFVLACSLIFLGIMLYIDVVQYFVGKEYRVGITIVPILLMANLFLGVFYNLSIWYKLTGQTRFGAYISIIGAIITIALNYTLIPIMGYMGSAWATFICYAVMMIISFIIGQKHYHVDYEVGKIFGILALAIGLYVISIYNPFTTTSFKFAFNTLLLFVFIGVEYLVERKNIAKIMNG
jgi:O-antigen/teichoic acid export membrane protein